MGRWYHRIAATTVFYLSVAAAPFFISPAYAEDALPEQTGTSTSADTRHVSTGWNAPAAVKKLADWVIDSGDNRSMPFVIVEKSEAKVFVFNNSGDLLGSAWALIGRTRGDDSVPGIGTMPLAKITPDMRTTPAGRFIATIGQNLGKRDVLWVDYPTSVSLHRVINTNPAEHRLERIVSMEPADHRISYGCINVPAQFFDSLVNPTFKDTNGIVYILPEVKEMRAVFPAYYDVEDLGKVQAALN